MAEKLHTSKKPEAKEEIYVPKFENFPLAQEQWMRGLVGMFSLQLYNIKQIRYVDRSQDPYTSAAAYWDPLRKEIVVRGPLTGEHAQYELARTLFHELAHGVLDPMSYVVVDHSTMTYAKDANGQYQYEPSLNKVFGSPKEMIDMFTFMSLSLSQAYETNTYLDPYQDMLGSKLKGLRGERHVLMVQLSIPHNSTERNDEIQKEMKRVQEEINILGSVLMRESWAIAITLAFLNPKGLEMKVNSQKKTWSEQGMSDADSVLGGGQKTPFVDTYVSSQKILKKFLKVNDAGLEKKRKKLKTYLKDNPLPQ